MTTTKPTPPSDWEVAALRDLEAIDQEIDNAERVRKTDAEAHREGLKILRERRDSMLWRLREWREGGMLPFDADPDDNDAACNDACRRAGA